MSAGVDDGGACAVRHCVAQRILTFRIVHRDEPRLRLRRNVMLILRDLVLARGQEGREHGRYDCKWHG